MPNFIFFEKGKLPRVINTCRFPEDVHIQKDDGTSFEIITGSYFSRSSEYFFAYEKLCHEPDKSEVLNAAEILEMEPVIRHI